MHIGRHRRLRRLALSGVGLLVAIGFAAPAMAAVPDPERTSTTPTSWHWYTGVSPSDLSAKINQTGDRIVSLHVDSTSPLLLTAALVHNAGVYQRGWWWYYDQSPSQLAQHLSDNNARLIDLETYVDNGTRYFAGVMVQNTGQAAKPWWWYYGLSAAQVNQRLTDHNARLVDVEPYGPADSPSFAVVMIPNTGVDAVNWHWYYDQTAAQLVNKLQQYSSRPIDIARQGPDTYTMVMQQSNAFFLWPANMTAAALDDYAAQNGSRLIDVEPYYVNGAKLFTGVLLDNSNQESARIRSIMRPGLDSGRFGAYLKKVGGPVLTGLAQDRLFEPASAIKALPELYAMHQVELGHDSLGTPGTITYRSCPGSPGPTDSGSCTNQTYAKDICPDSRASATYNSSLGNAISLMMSVSDNRMTRGIIEHYGYGHDRYDTGAATINAYANAHGIGSQTNIEQVLGCGFNNGLRNDWSLLDAGKLYEGVVDGTLLSGAARKQFYSYQGIGTGSSSGGLYNLIQQEAAKQGKSSAVAKFASLTTYSGKGGSYDIGCSSSCTYRYYRTVFNRMSLPYKVHEPSGTKIKTRAFVGGVFANDVPIYCSAQSTCPSIQAAGQSFGQAYTELWRPAIADALKTW